MESAIQKTGLPDNLLFQMFFGMPSRIVNEQGKAIQGTLGFVECMYCLEFAGGY